MKHKKILLVANDNLEILNVQRELTKHHIDHSLHIAKNGLDALALLMGCSSPQLENYTKTGKVQPDIILMDAEAPNLNMIELLCIMQKYYSLQKIRVYLIVTDPEKIELAEAKKYGIAGVVAKPFNMESTAFDGQKLMTELGKTPQKAWLPFATGLPFLSLDKCFSFLSKIKYSTLHFTSAVAVKTGIAGTVVLTGALLGSSLASGESEIPAAKSAEVTRTELRSIIPPPPATEELAIEDLKVQSSSPAQGTLPGSQKKESPTLNTTSQETIPVQKAERSFRIVVTEEETSEELN